VYFDSAAEMADYQARLDAEERKDSDGRVFRCDNGATRETEDARERMIRRDQDAWKQPAAPGPAAAPEREDNAGADARARYLERLRTGQG
jgi:hypothetical protein